LAKSIGENDYEVVLVAPYDEYSDRLSKEFEFHDIYMNNQGTNPKEDAITIIEFYKLYKKIRPDAVLHFTIKPNIYGTFACGLLGIKTINNVAGLGTLFIKQNFITKIAKWLYKLSQKKADKIFFQNGDDLREFVIDKLVNEDKCDVLPGSGVDTRRFLPMKRTNNNKIVFLLIARMLWDKGVGEYVEAAKIIKKKYDNVEFQLLGFLDVENKSAISREQMDIWVEEGCVNYLGTTDDVRNYIAKSDCIVLPSFYREGTPRTLLESASMAKPIITTDNVGCRDVVDDGINGYICKPRNSGDLAVKIEKFIALSKDKVSDMGKNGRDKMLKEFDECIVIDKYLHNINKVLNKK
jgi:glycosyltransferase involved in cell wall biosynthesis